MTKTYSDQIHEHLTHLQAQGLSITKLTIDSHKWLRYRAIGETKGRGELAYSKFTAQKHLICFYTTMI